MSTSDWSTSCSVKKYVVLGLLHMSVEGDLIVMQETSETNGENWDGVALRWREHFVKKLQDLYGLPEEEAGKKAEAWLGWLKRQPNSKLQTLPAEKIAAEIRSPRRRRGPASSRVRLGKSKSRSAVSS